MMLLDTGKLSTSDHEERPVAENPGTLLFIRSKEKMPCFWLHLPTFLRSVGRQTFLV